MNAWTLGWLTGLTAWNVLLMWWAMVDGAELRDLRERQS